MSTSSLPAIPASMARKSNDFHPVRRARSLSDLRTEASMKRGPGNNTYAWPSEFRAQFNASSEAGRARNVTIDVPQGQTTLSSETVSNAERRGALYVAPSAGQKKKEEERHFANLLQQYTSVKSSGSRSYNYEDKYPEDQAGEELGSNSRFFNVYLDEAEKYDEDMIRGLSGTLDALLVFAALFSAVVTTFVVDTSHAFEPNQTLITSSLLYEQVQYFRANGNATIIATVQPSQYTPDSLTHSTSDIWINGLFFASLSLSLATALLSVLAKQWLQAYTSVTSGSARETALIRHLRFMGFEEWKVPQIIGFLPLILHASLAVFIAGLIVFLRALYPGLSWVVIGISSPAFFIYLVSIVLPVIYIRCPYRITVLYTPMKTLVLPLQLLFEPLRRWRFRLFNWHQGWNHSHGFLKLVRSVSTAFSSRTRFIVSNRFHPGSTLKDSELRVVQNDWSCLPVLCDGIVWLHSMSSNISVRQVAASSLSSNEVIWFSRSEAKKVQHSKLHLTAASAEKELWDPSKRSSSSHQAATQLADLFLKYDLHPDDLQNDWFDTVHSGRTSAVAFLHHVWEIPVDSITLNGGTALQLAVARDHYATAKRLLEFGANPNFMSSDDFAGSTALSLLCRHIMDATSRQIGTLLLDSGADINLRNSRMHSRTPLYNASTKSGNCELIKWLIGNGADVDQIGGELGTALHNASRWDNVETVKVLLEHNATINLKNENGRTALGVAIDWGASRVEPFLREQGAIELLYSE